MNVQTHVTTHGHHDARTYCMRQARACLRIADHTIDQTAAERARLDAMAWLDLECMINAARVLGV